MVEQQFDRQLRVSLEQCRQARGDDPGAEYLRQADAYRTARAPSRPSYRLAGREHRALDRFGVAEQGLAGLGQCVAVAAPIEQGAGQLRLQPRQATRYGGVIHTEPQRCGGKGSGPRHLKQVPEIRPVGHVLHFVSLCKNAHRLGFYALWSALRQMLM